jgi:hypothetical protein
MPLPNFSRRKSIMSFKSLLVGASILLSVTSNVFAGAGPKFIGDPHSNWTWPSTIQKMEVDMKFTDDPGDGVPYFYANQFTLVDSSSPAVRSTGGYLGLQGNVAGSGHKGVMFSMWGDNNSYTNGSASCNNNGNEGLGTSCAMTYNWVAGKTYRFRLENNGLNYKAYVTDTSTQTETYIATIVASPQGSAPSPVGIGLDIGQWIEYYGNGQISDGCATFAYAKLHWSTPSGNGGAVAPNPRSDHFEYGNDPTACHNTLAWADSTGSWHEYGNPGTSTSQQMISSSGKYVYAAPSSTEGCGGGNLNVDSSGTRDCSQMTRVALPSGKIALQTDSGYYLSCANGGGSTVSATSRTAGANESFTETTISGKVYYQSTSGKYLTAVNGGGGVLRCDATNASTNEGFIPLKNSAPFATVSVSSENASNGQNGIKAIDNRINGYPGDYTREWVAPNAGANSWINLSWSSPVTVYAISLYDRPNTTDQVLTGTLSFSDGSSVSVGALPNDGVTSPAINIPPRDLTSVKFTINSTAGSNTGLAEIQVWTGPKFVCSEATDTNANHVTAGRAYTTTTGTFIKTTTWYANGSNDNLGTSGSTSVKLAQTSAGYYTKGSCPAAPSAPTIGTPTASVSGTSVTVSGTAADVNNNLSKVELEFDSNGTWIVASGTTSWSLAKSDLPVGTHNVHARATDTTNLVSAISSSVTFTTTNAPVCMTAKNTDHISAGRAHQCGTIYTPQACANGSNNNLGSSSTYAPATSSIQLQSSNYWVKVSSCP